jgi:catechol 2,3-dioxygenase-like lactoylglutathione lyase family enzyme
MTSRAAALTIDSTDPQLLADFWCAALGWREVERDEAGISIGGDGPFTLDLMRVPEPRSGKNRLHLDLRADGSSTADELERLLALGARRVDVGQGPDVSWTVLADPEGNEFCLLSRTVQDLSAPGGG